MHIHVDIHTFIHIHNIDIYIYIYIYINTYIHIHTQRHSHPHQVGGWHGNTVLGLGAVWLQGPSIWQLDVGLEVCTFAA